MYVGCIKQYSFSLVFKAYMQKGISVWLDMPLGALARRIAAVGTDSRPLLHHELGDPYTKVGFLSSLLLFICTMLSGQQTYLLTYKLADRLSDICLLFLKREKNIMQM